MQKHYLDTRDNHTRACVVPYTCR